MNLTIALVDWNMMGHHPMYFRMLSAGFRRLGVEVVCATVPKLLEELREELKGDPGMHFVPVKHTPEMIRLPLALRRHMQGARLFGGLSQALKHWENLNQKSISLVFFNSIYDKQFTCFPQAQPWFRRPWSGIYLHARSFRVPGSPIPNSNTLPCPERIFTMPKMMSACVIDEGVVDQMTLLAGGKPVHAFPDVTDESLSAGDTEHGLAAKALAFANGRRMVVCLGNLQKTKGILELCQAAIDPRLADICFFFGGEVYWGGMSVKETRRVQQVWENASNIMTHLTRISDDTIINSLVRASDVVYAAYTNFPNSSNIMTKAAAFKRPVIVSDGFLMAERVKKFGTGRIVPEGDVESIIRQILSLCHKEDPQPYGYEDYHAQHSSAALDAALQQILSEIPKLQ